MVKALLLSLALFGQTDSLPVYEMPEIVVTATRLSLPVIFSPWPVEVIEVKADEVTDLADALEHSVASDVRSYGDEGHSAFPILGGILASRVLILANGVHMNSRRDGVIDLALLPLAPGDRVEVVKGPLSALYGSAAIGGVVNVIPSTENGLMTSFETSSRLGMNAGVRAAYNLDMFGGRLAGSWLTNPGFRSNDDVTRYHAGASAWVDPNEKRHIELETSYLWRSLGVPGPQPDTSDSAFVPPVFGNSLVTSLYDREEDGLLTLNLKSTFSPDDNYSHTLNLYLVSHDLTYTWPSQSDSGDIELTSGNYKDVRIGGDFQFSLDVRDFLIWASGISAESEELKGEWEGQDSHLGIWTELLAELGIFVPSAAARLEYSGAYGHFLSPELGLSVNPIENKLKISAAYGRSFRAPTLNDIFWPADEYSQGNPDLVPERSQSVVFSADSRPFEFLKLSLSGSWKELKDMISWVPFQGSVWRPENTDKVTIWGAELSSSLKLKLFTGSLGLAYNHAQETRKIVTYSDWVTGETRLDTVTRQAAFIPPLVIKGDLQLRPWKGGEVSARAAWTGERVNYYPDYSSAPVVVDSVKSVNPSLKIDLAISQTLFKIVTLEIGVHNLLDDRTAQQFGTSYKDLDYPTAPRTLYIGVSAYYK